MFRVLFTGGGTGGHIYPLAAVAEELQDIAKSRNLTLDFRYFGAPDIFAPVLNEAGIRVEKIFSAKIRRYFDPRNIFDIPKFFLAIIQLLWKIFWFMPDVVFSKGGPGALPVVLVARFYRIPILIHESDTIPGLTNRISAKFARRIAISFSSAASYFKKEAVVTGNPMIRKLLAGSEMEQSAAKKALGFSPDLPLIFFIGASSGATRINDFVLDILPELLPGFQVLHQTE